MDLTRIIFIWFFKYSGLMWFVEHVGEEFGVWTWGLTLIALVTIGYFLEKKFRGSLRRYRRIWPTIRFRMIFNEWPMKDGQLRKQQLRLRINAELGLLATTHIITNDNLTTFRRKISTDEETNRGKLSKEVRALEKNVSSTLKEFNTARDLAKSLFFRTLNEIVKYHKNNLKELATLTGAD